MNYEHIKVTEKKEVSEVEITGAILVVALDGYRKKALKEIGEQVEIAGFRKGHIPEKVIVDRYGELYVLEEAAEIALKDIAPEIIEKHAPSYIGRPKIGITKLAPGNPIEFKIDVSIMPEVKLPDYKKIAKEAAKESKDKEAKEDHEVSDKEVNDVVEEVRKQRAHEQYHINHKDAKGHEHNDEEIDKLKPEFNDEFVKSIGSFESVEDFKKKAKENILKEKESRAKDKVRTALLEKLVTETSVAIPEPLIELEINKMFAQFENDVSSMGLKIEEYLKHVNKKPEDLMKDWKPDAEKRAKLNLVLETIAEKEKISADKKLVDEEVKHLTTHYKDVDAVRAAAYVDHMLKIEKTVKFLEEQE